MGENVRGTAFRPVKGTEEKIMSTEYQEGYVYFATDTKKIYLDANGEAKIPMGGTSGIYYGKMTFDVPPEAGQTEFYFSFAEIEGNDSEERITVPNVDDLILNIPDGCFYRVVGIEFYDGEDRIKTTKLTIAGSGDGTGSGGGGNAGKMTLTAVGSKTFSILDSGSCVLQFQATAVDANGDPTEDANYSLRDVNTNKVYKSGKVNQGLNSITINGKDLNIGTTKMRLYVQMDIGGSGMVEQNLLYTVTTSQMILTWEYNNTTNNYLDKNFDIYYKVSGEGISKNVKAIIDDYYEIILASDLISTSEQHYTITKDQYAGLNISHGAHKIELKAYTNFGAEDIYADSVINSVIFVDSNNKTPIISWGLFDRQLKQYDTVYIPIIIYDKENIGNTASVVLSEDGNIITTWNEVQNNKVYTWAYTPMTAGNHQLSVRCGITEYSMSIEVISLGITIDEVADYAFKFKASEFASNSAIQEWNSNGVTASFSERFDWINGGLQNELDENGNNSQYVCVKAGNTMTINYPIFKTNPIDETGRGKTLKIIFKATNCRDYDGQVMSCKKDRWIWETSSIENLLVIDDNTELEVAEMCRNDNEEISLINPVTINYVNANDEATRKNFDKKYVKVNDIIYYCKFIETSEGSKQYYASWYEIITRQTFEGVNLTAQSASFNSSAKEYETQYCEDKKIEFEFDIGRPSNTGKNYIKLWIDGVPCYVDTYSNSIDTQFIGPGGTYLTIGSLDCDVYIYLIKLYEQGLTDEEHLQNFIADAPNSNEILNRYQRNDILDERGKISPSKLATKNPNCLVHVYDIPRMTLGKKDIVSGCTYDQYHGSEKVVLHADDVKIRVQGTSSVAYLISAANIDSDFETSDGGSSFIDPFDDKVTYPNGWSMDGGDAIECKYFCTKVNVASCENANNALNQEWYNMFQPYQSVLRCKNKRARDTMQFTNGVVFIADHNTTVSGTTENNLFKEEGQDYIKNPYPKLYAIGNMGNSKKNIHVFHDLENPDECCIEVGDNQTAQQKMINYDYSGFNDNSDIGEADELFEFRYPDGNSEATEKMRAGWNRFVSWMAHSNPQPKYESHTANSERDFKAFAFNQKTGKPVTVYKLNATNTEYEIVESFDPEITTYYTETIHTYGYTNLPLDKPETFKAYTFKGYTNGLTTNTSLIKNDEGQWIIDRSTKETHPCFRNENGESWQKNYTPLVKGISINTYANTPEMPEYTHDTYEYRMAKMLSECEDYLVMDSVLFHYLFIETHCLIDNVAKNTFWSTEDCVHWNLIKDYDNDTSDGNDNNGKFTRTYGMEIQDKVNENTYVFNAHESVWLNFIDGLGPVLDEFYTRMNTKEVKYNGKMIKPWDHQAYLDAFDEWQRRIPERVWIETYQRVYVRPNNVYNDNMYLSMMEGGQKRYQRNQFETYQNTYMRSKHDSSGLAAVSKIWARGQGQGCKDMPLPIKTYQDCYVYITVGSSSYLARVKRNQVIITRCPDDNLNNATISFSPASVITEVGDENMQENGKIIGQLGEYSPDQLGLSACGKLRKLVLASNDSDYDMELKQGLTFENCKMLEELYAANVTSYADELDLSSCENFRKLEGKNTTFASITLPDNAPVTDISITAPTAFKASNLRRVENFDWSPAQKLSTLTVENIDESPAVKFNSLQLVKDTIDNNLSSYTLHKVLWKMTDANEISLDKIQILDKLLAKAQDYNRNPAGLLSGELIVTDDAYPGNDPTDIYEKYANAEAFPNLDIKFLNKENESKLITVEIQDGNGNIVWKRKAMSGSIINQNFLANGPQGPFDITSIVKSSTPAKDYSFKNEWILKTQNSEIVINSEYPYYDTKIATDVLLIPQFNDTDRYYTLKFYDANLELFETKSYVFNTPWANAQPKTIPYKEPEANFGLKEAYNFVGYTLIKDGSAIVPNTYTISNDQSFYAKFEKVDDISTIVHPEWFDFKEIVWDDDAEYQSELYSTYFENLADRVPTDENGRIPGKINKAYKIHIKEGLKLKGKITIPIEYDGAPVTTLGQCFNGISQTDYQSGQRVESGITHVFMQTVKNKKPQLYTIGANAFGYNPSLQYFDFTSVRIIKAGAFRACPLDVELFVLGQQTYSVETNAFNQAFSNIHTPITFELPSELRYVDMYSFAHFGFVLGSNSSTLQLGTPSKPSKLRLGSPKLNKQAGWKKFVQNEVSGKEPFENITLYSDIYKDEKTEIDSYNGKTYQLWQYFINDEDSLNNTTFTFGI